MKKKPPVCPKCGAVFELDITPKAKRARAAEEKARKAAPSPELIDEIPIETDGTDDAMIEDVDELGEDAIDMDEVIDIEEDEPIAN